MNKRQMILLSVLGVVAAGALAVFLIGGRGDKSAQASVPRPAAAKSGAPAAPAGTPGAPAATPAGPAHREVQQETPAAAKDPAAYEYTATGRRDPFVPLIVKNDSEKRKGVPPIENYEVAEFKLIAVLWGKEGYYGVITLPDGKSYTIREGMKLGLHKGKVFRITRDAVVIREQVRDYSGVVSAKDTVLKLRREEEG